MFQIQLASHSLQVTPESVAQKYSVKEVFLEISQNSQESTCARVSFLIKFKKETLAQVFFCEFCEISRNTFLQNISGRLLLDITPNACLFSFMTETAFPIFFVFFNRTSWWTFLHGSKLSFCFKTTLVYKRKIHFIANVVCYNQIFNNFFRQLFYGSYIFLCF